MKKNSKKDIANLSPAAVLAACSRDKTTEEPTVEVDCVMINGVRWATRNLAAHGEFVKNPQDFGALFQWGRKGDGHEQRTSARYPNDNDSSENGIVSDAFDANGQIVSSHAAFGKFIKQVDEPCDWCSPQQDNLWNSGTESSPGKAPNDPCPPGWRMPTDAELDALDALESADSTWTDDWNGTGVAGRVFGTAPNTLFLPAAGYRSGSDGGLNLVGTNGYYWSSTVYRTSARGLNFFSGNVGVYDYALACGRSVRCVLE